MLYVRFCQESEASYEKISENAGSENEFVGYEFNMIQYDKNEFILKQAKENSELSEQVTQTQIALTEVYEMMA